MMSMFIFGILGGVTAAYFAWPYGWLPAFGAYAIGGALAALVPALIEWRQEVVRERMHFDEAPPDPVMRRVHTTARRETPETRDA
jgi:hypothetical protein